jgi:hypothetical protein
MTGQDAVLDAAALEREAHVWAPIVEGEDAPAVVDDKDWTMAAVHNKPPLGFQLLKAACEHEFSIWHVHQYTSGGCLFERALGISALVSSHASAKGRRLKGPRET